MKHADRKAAKKASARSHATAPGLVVLVLMLTIVAMIGCSGQTAVTTAMPPTTSSAASTEGGEMFTPTTGAEKTSSTSVTSGTTAATGGDSTGWKTVFEFKGTDNGEKTSELFKLSGAPARLTWKVETDSMWILAAFVEPEGHDLKAKGGFPVIMESEDKEGSVPLDLKAGSYYVYVNAANCKWTVAIQEQK